jgi:hypothetical protein
VQTLKLSKGGAVIINHDRTAPALHGSLKGFINHFAARICMTVSPKSDASVFRFLCIVTASPFLQRHWYWLCGPMFS